MNIAVYNKEYQSRVIDLILKIQRVEFGLEITAEEQPDLSSIEGYYQNGVGNFWVAYVDDDLIGTISLLDIGNSSVALRKMFVKQNYRGREHNVAIKLLSEAEVWARENGTRFIYLGTTEKFKAAHRFYEKNGYSTIPKDDLPDTFPVMDVDNRFYSKML